jgi:toxin-antitoxin system PIN domain toxin
MTVLLDANVLIALLLADHVHHEAVERWMAGWDGKFATCPITQGALVRLVTREAGTPRPAIELLSSVSQDERHSFWSDDRSYTEVSMNGVIGHRQVTDAYLAHLARRNRGRIATIDSGLAEAYRDVAELVQVA